MRSSGVKFFAVFLGLFSIVSAASADVYNIDPAHASVGFSVSHMTVSEVKGSFKDVAGVIEYDPANPEAVQIDVAIQVKSINTGVEGRDGHLQQGEFFDAVNHPVITFKSAMVEKTDDGLTVVGDLTIKGVVKRTSFPVKIVGPVTSPMDGKTAVIGISGELTVDRQEFGVSWNKDMDNGGYLVGNEVKISFSVEAKR